MSGKPLHGRHVFLMVAGAFGLIVCVNLVMAVTAIRTFPGMEVRNSYVASQTFERDRRRQDALGWQASAAYDGTTLAIAIDAASGEPADVVDFTARLQRPTHQQSDHDLTAIFDGTHYRADIALDPGLWTLHVAGMGRGGQPFRQKLTLWVDTARPG